MMVSQAARKQSVLQ